MEIETAFGPRTNGSISIDDSKSPVPSTYASSFASRPGKVPLLHEVLRQTVTVVVASTTGSSRVVTTKLAESSHSVRQRALGPVAHAAVTAKSVAHPRIRSE